MTPRRAESATCSRTNRCIPSCAGKDRSAVLFFRRPEKSGNGWPGRDTGRMFGNFCHGWDSPISVSGDRRWRRVGNRWTRPCGKPRNDSRCGDRGCCCDYEGGEPRTEPGKQGTGGLGYSLHPFETCHQLKTKRGRAGHDGQGRWNTP